MASCTLFIVYTLTLRGLIGGESGGGQALILSNCRRSEEK